MNYLVRDRDVIFNLAGQVSHIDSMRDPYTDLEINCRSQLTILEACRYHNPGVKVVFAGTRQVYGRPDSLPVNETPSRAADRRQRHQQGGRRVLPPRLQQRVRRPRLLAAADQRLRPAAADQAQPPGLHRLVHPAGDRGRDDSDLRRRLAAPRFRLRGRCGRRVPARGRERRLQRRGVQRRRRRADQPPRSDDAADRDRRHRAASSTSSGRPRRRRSTSATSTPTRRSSQRRTGWTPDGRRCATGCARTIAFYREHFDRYVDAPAGRGAACDAPRASRSCRWRRATTRADVRAAIDRVVASGWFVLGPEVEAFEREFAAACGRGARGRRRQRHRCARADPARARHRAGRRSDHDAAVGRLHARSRS